jgi:pimeloyl-ACP methyl ester carboxylesterase
MIAPLAKIIDWSVVQALSLPFEIKLRLGRGPSAKGPILELQQALQFLNGPDFIPAESRPAQIKFDGSLHFRFPAPRPGDIAVNNVVYGRLYRCGGQWQKRPVIILLHGGGDFFNHRFGFPVVARCCNRRGLNAATLVLPYHFQRRPHQIVAWHSLLTAQTISQGVAEIRALTGWLLGEGCPAVALAGISYGGLFAGLAASQDARLASAVLIAPRVDMNQVSLLAERVLWPRIREMGRGQRATYEALDRTPLNLILSRPVIPRENILLIEGRHDLLVGRGPVEELWQAWGCPERWRLPYGHITMLGAAGLPGRIIDWLTPRLKNAAVRTPIA